MVLLELSNESGIFKIDEKGILWEYIPHESNIIGKNIYRTLIIPEQVNGFFDEFGRGITVTETFILPMQLDDLGVQNLMGKLEASGREIGCVFADGIFPRVLLPEKFPNEYLGFFAFENSKIKELCFPETYMHGGNSCRALKGCTVETLFASETYWHENPDSCCCKGMFLPDCCIRGAVSYNKRNIGCFPEDNDCKKIW